MIKISPAEWLSHSLGNTTIRKKWIQARSYNYYDMAFIHRACYPNQFPISTKSKLEYPVHVPTDGEMHFSFRQRKAHHSISAVCRLINGSVPALPGILSTWGLVLKNGDIYVATLLLLFHLSPLHRFDWSKVRFQNLLNSAITIWCV